VVEVVCRYGFALFMLERSRGLVWAFVHVYGRASPYLRRGTFVYICAMSLLGYSREEQ